MRVTRRWAIVIVLALAACSAGCDSSRRTCGDHVREGGSALLLDRRGFF
jgi:hypothetical protein